MHYTKNLFCELILKDSLFEKIRNILANDPTAFSGSLVLDKELGKSGNRTSEHRWIKSDELRNLFDPIVGDVNRVNEWNFQVSHAEHFQHARYGVGGQYDWHVDQHPHPHKLDGMIRKISFTLFLNDGYEGGELDLEVRSPNAESRNATFANKKGSMVFFLADVWHRVRPVTSGVRESLVGWYLGPPFV